MDYSARPPQFALCETLGQQLLARQWHLATAESCTGGGIAAAITQVAGSSAWFECGIVSYADHIKHSLLGVRTDTLAEQGAVSEAVVREMAKGVLTLSQANIAVAVSGIAGPTGGSTEKPVGTLWFAWALATGEARTHLYHFSGTRIAIQQQAIVQGLRGLVEFLEAVKP
jgi:nicotinamide-nucleotide amidase